MRDELRCPKCKSSQTRYRAKTNDHRCYVCGNIYINVRVVEELE